MAMAWSYAALRHLQLDPSVVEVQIHPVDALDFEGDVGGPDRDIMTVEYGRDQLGTCLPKRLSPEALQFQADN